MVTRSGWSKLTNAYQSVTSAVRSRAVIGASRWLDANRLDGVSTNKATAKATKDFRFFIGFSSGSKVGGRRQRDLCCPGVAATPTAAPNGFVYCTMYVRDARSDWIAPEMETTQSNSYTGLHDAAMNGSTARNTKRTWNGDPE